MNNQKGVIHLLVPLLLLLVIGAAGYILISQGIIKNPFKNLSLFQKGPKIELKTQYENPFNKESQYVNPFETYKNPFVTSR